MTSDSNVQTSSALAVRDTRRLTPTESAAIMAIIDQASKTDGLEPVSEQAMLAISRSARAAKPAEGEQSSNPLHLLAYLDGELVGYAQLGVAGGDVVSAELVVDPTARRRGAGRLLLERVIANSRGRILRIWAHGDHPAAAVLATASGLVRSRLLWQLGRSLVAPIDSPRLPSDVTLRSFAVGADEPAWLALNARAFASHPEQGRWGLEDLLAREQEPWFDPDGFLLAEKAGQLVGFHWTKIHNGPEEAIGEVYVLGVDPAQHGTGLGSALTNAGLRHLQNKGLTKVMLYVDESNPAAVALYQKLGFTHVRTDVEYSSQS